MPNKLPHFAFRIAPEDRAILEAVSKAERMPMAIVIRIAVRKYAKELGIEEPKLKKKK